ncbi:hypothetical protein [Streptomyces sp. NBC_00046]|uniref:hypothetical protein n=1 Tax=unclassified Streptomyces TaxID=2593676 RepID=UPI0032496403
MLDELPPSRNQRYIRQLLVHTGTLDERHEDLERIPGWLEHELADKPAAHANVARPFLNWFLLRRARQRAATIPPPPTATCGDASAPPWTSWPGSTNATWPPSPTSPRNTSTTGSLELSANAATWSDTS